MLNEVGKPPSYRDEKPSITQHVARWQTAKAMKPSEKATKFSEGRSPASWNPNPIRTKSEMAPQKTALTRRIPKFQFIAAP